MTWSTMRVGPLPANKRAVPAEDCLRRDEERTPALARYEASEEGDERTIAPGEAGSWDLAAKHGELVAEHEDLGILRSAISPVEAKALDDTSEQTKEEGQGHGG
jgi:hypothetical protein